MKKKGLLRDVSVSAFANIISMLLGMLAVAIIPKFVGVDVYGYYQLYVLYTTYAILTELGFSDGNYLSVGGRKYEELDYQQQTNQFWLLFATQLLLSITFISVCGRIIEKPETLQILTLTAICAIFIHGRYYLYMLMQGTGRIQEYAIVIIIERVLSIGLGFLSLALGYRGYTLLIAFDIVGRALSMAYAMYVCRSIVFVRPRLRIETMKVALMNIKPGIALTVVTMASSLVIGVAKTFVEISWDIETFAKISLSINFVNLLVRCANAIAVGVFPYAVRLPEKNKESTYGTFSVLFTVLAFCVLPLYMPVAKLLAWWFPQYQDGLRYLIFAVPMCVFECRNAVLENAFMKAQRAERAMLIINVSSVVAGILTSFVCAYVIRNLVGVMISLSVVLGLRCITTSIYLTRKWKIRRRELLWRGCEAILLVLFVLTNEVGNAWAILMYIVAVGAFVCMNRSVVVESIRNARTS